MTMTKEMTTMGGDLMLDPQHPTSFVEGTDLAAGVARLAHGEELLPERRPTNGSGHGGSSND